MSIKPAIPYPLVSTEWLSQNMYAQNLKILDASWYLPQMSRNAAQEYKKQHIPGTLFADIDILSDHNTSVPHNMPKTEVFAQELGRMGISHNDAVIIYDTGLPTASRLWYMLRSIGHINTAVLDGGFRKWLNENRPVTTEVPNLPKQIYETLNLPNFWATQKEVEIAIKSDNIQVVDARDNDRYEGTVKEYRDGVRAGHIPSARSLPFFDIIDTTTGLFENSETLKNQFKKAGLHINRPIIAYCGSGVTACNLAIANEIINGPELAIYDGSWAEWGGSDTLPIETGNPFKEPTQ